MGTTVHQVRRTESRPIFPVPYNANRPLRGNDLALIKLSEKSTKQPVRLPPADSLQGTSCLESIK